MNKLNKKLSIFFLLLLFFLFSILFKFPIPCLFKKLFSLSCPACGLTRSIFALLNLNILTSLYYNILGIPVFLLLVITYFLIVIDFIKKENYLSSFYLFIVKYYKLIICLFILSFIINNIHKI